MSSLKMVVYIWAETCREKFLKILNNRTASYSNDPEFRSLVGYGLHPLTKFSIFLSLPSNSQDIASKWAEIASFHT